MKFRLSNTEDLQRILQVHFNAFGEEEGPTISRLVTSLLQNQISECNLSIVAEIEKLIVGHVVFSPVCLSTTPNMKAFILSPLATDPKFQRKRVGTELVEYGINLLRQQHVKVVFVYGDPAYYSGFGFKVEIAANFEPPYTLEYPHGWQAIALENDNSLKLLTQVQCVESLSKPGLW